MFHWLELLTETLNFLQIFILRKATTRLIQYFRKAARKSTKKYIFDIVWTFKSKYKDLQSQFLSLYYPFSGSCY